MYKYKFAIISVLVILFFSCVDSGTNITNYKIINDTENSIELLVFNTGQGNNLPKKVNSYIINGKGLLIEITLELPSVMDQDDPTLAFEGDSIRVIYNNTKVEAINALGGGILSLVNYTIEGNQRTYTITQENYDNAVPCNGPCD